MSNSPAAFESKAIRSPSGDHRGVVTQGPSNEVNWTAFDPSLLHTQISKWPERADTKATLLPSGENCGCMSSRVDEIKVRTALAPTGTLLPAPGAGMRPMLA